MTRPYIEGEAARAALIAYVQRRSEREGFDSADTIAWLQNVACMRCLDSAVKSKLPCECGAA